jgi:hypothetical protein
LAAVVVGVLVVLSTLLTITTVFPGADIAAVSVALLAALAFALATAAISGRSHAPQTRARTAWERRLWAMPLETLAPPTPSRLRRLALLILRTQVYPPRHRQGPPPPDS